MPEGHHLIPLQPGFTRTRPEPAVGFEENLFLLADGLLGARHPKHPDFDPRLTRKAVTTRELKTTLEWITRAMEDGSRRVVVDSQQIPQVRKIVHALGLGEVHDGPLNVTTDWRLRINKKAAETPDAGPDLSVDDIRGWIEDLGYTGLDRHVSNLIIAAYALLDDRTWVFQTSPLPKAPELERIASGYGLRAVELPTEDEFHTVLGRAGTIFGRTVSRVLFARNVARLAEGVREVAEQHRVALGEVRTLLTENAAHLGLTGPDGADAPRTKSTKAAADLVARLLRTAEPAAFVRELAAATYDVTDEEIAGALRHAPEVAAALRRTEWSLLAETVRDLAGRDDSVGERAARFRDEVRRTARDHEQAVSLVPVLDRLPDTVMALMREATRLAQGTRPAQPTAPPVTPQPTAEDVSLTTHGEPRVPSTPTPTQPSAPEPGAPSRNGGGAQTAVPRQAARPPAVHLIEPTRLEASLASTVAEIGTEIRAYLAAHPGTRVKVTWHPVTDSDSDSDSESGPDGSTGPATEPGEGNTD